VIPCEELLKLRASKGRSGWWWLHTPTECQGQGHGRDARGEVMHNGEQDGPAPSRVLLGPHAKQSG